jgi:hypothetical protein
MLLSGICQLAPLHLVSGAELNEVTSVFWAQKFHGVSIKRLDERPTVFENMTSKWQPYPKDDRRYFAAKVRVRISPHAVLLTLLVPKTSIVLLISIPIENVWRHIVLEVTAHAICHIGELSLGATVSLYCVSV